MISKTFVTAFVATCLMAGSEASPCKASSKTTEASITVATTEASSTTDAATVTGLSTGSLSSTEDLVVTVTTSQSAGETLISSEDTSTALSSTEISSRVISIISESTTTTFEPSITASVDTTMSVDTTTSVDTYTDASTTTTSIEGPIRTNLIINGDFEADDTDVWSHSPESGSMEIYPLIDESPARGRYAKSISGEDLMMTINYPFTKGVIKADLEYSVSAWIRPDAQCDTARICCKYNNVNGVGFLSGFQDTTNTHEQWQEITTSCTFTQDQVDMGGLVLAISFWCYEWNRNLVDSVVFI